MKTKVITICVVMTVLLAVSTANANTIASSTMYFGTAGGYDLTDEGGGIYSGVLPALSTNGGFDIYAENGSTAWFGDDPGSGPVWSSQAIGAAHDAWPTWTPDTPDWYQYSLKLYEDGGVQKWAVRNHPGATEATPWYDGGRIAMGVPMSGTIDYAAMTVTETDTGAYISGTGTSEIPGGAATKGGGAAAWDMDWSWGSEVVPLAGNGVFDVSITGSEGSYAVTLTPVPEPATMCLLGLGSLVLIRRRKRA